MQWTKLYNINTDMTRTAVFLWPLIASYDGVCNSWHCIQCGCLNHLDCSEGDNWKIYFPPHSKHTLLRISPFLSKGTRPKRYLFWHFCWQKDSCWRPVLWVSTVLNTSHKKYGPIETPPRICLMLSPNYCVLKINDFWCLLAVLWPVCPRVTKGAGQCAT